MNVLWKTISDYYFSATCDVFLEMKTLLPRVLPPVNTTMYLAHHRKVWVRRRAAGNQKAIFTRLFPKSTLHQVRHAIISFSSDLSYWRRSIHIIVCTYIRFFDPPSHLESIMTSSLLLHNLIYWVRFGLKKLKVSAKAERIYYDQIDVLIACRPIWWPNAQSWPDLLEICLLAKYCKSLRN